MSDTVDPPYPDPGVNDGAAKKAKKAKPPRACDVCRRKRIRCDGIQGSGKPCSNCVTFKSECAYDEPPKRHGPPKGYTKILEERVAILEEMLRNAGIDPSKTLGGPLDKESIRQGVLPGRPPALETTRQGSVACGSSGASPSQIHTSSKSNDSETEPSDDDDIHHPVVDRLEGLSLYPMRERFFGKSSGFGLLKAAIVMKAQSGADDIEDSAMQSDSDTRKEFWTTQPWELSSYTEPPPNYQFPAPDLLQHLLTVYSEKIHPMSPVLHWPTFERSVHEGLHMRDHRFGAVVLMVCATASRYSDDPRVLLDGQDSAQSSGWMWFKEVQANRRSMLSPTTLYDLQLYCLLTLFLVGTSAPQAAWIAIGYAIRMAQDVGAHRRKFYGDRRTVKSELWKRAFWVLVLHDRGLSAALGRHYTLSPDEIDVDFPIECDDEYWITTDPNDSFKQPPGKPPRVAYFNYMLKMNNILGDMLRTLYPGHRHRSPGRSAEDDQQVIAEMDSALNNWFDDIPDHLRWMPSDEDPITFRQSAMLHTAYYRNQILVHRPFISGQSSSPLSISCMASCTNAARCIINIADVTRTRGGHSPGTIAPTFNAAIILLLQIFSQKRSGTLMDPQKGMVEVRRALNVLETLEERWSIAGAMGDILRGLATIGKLPLPPPRSTSKRKRETDTPTVSVGTPTSTTSTELEPPGAQPSAPPRTFHPLAPGQFSGPASTFINGVSDGLLAQVLHQLGSDHLSTGSGQYSAESSLANASHPGQPFEQMTSTDYAPYWIHPRIPFNSAFDSTNPTHMSPGFPEDMVASSYLSTVPASSINHGTEPTMLDHFMSSMANPNGSVGFYADDWQGTTRAGASWNNLGDPGTSGFHGSVNAGWSAAPTGADFTQWESGYPERQSAAAPPPSGSGPLQDHCNRAR